MKAPQFLALLAILTGLRLWLAGSEEWTSPEAYLYLISQHLEWAYFEGPSGLPALMRLSEWVFGPTPLGLRLPGVLFSLLATGAVFWAGRVYYSTLAGFWAVILINVLPAFNLAALRADTSLALLTFWALLAATTYQALQSGRTRHWLLVGLTGALGTLFSYDFLFGLAAVPLATTTGRKFRGQFRRPGLYAAFALWLVGSLGVGWWNAQHDWISFAGQTLLLLRTFAGGEAVAATARLAQALTGLGLLGLVATLIGGGWLAKRHFRARVILVFTGLPALLMLHRLYRGQDAMGYGLAAIALAAILATHLLFESEILPNLYRRLALGGASATLLLALLMTGAQLSTLTRTQSDLPWGALVDRLERAQTLHHPAGARPLLFVAGDRDLAAGLGFYLLTQQGDRSDFPPVYVRESQDLANQFGLWPRYDEVVLGDLPPDPNYKEERGTNPNLGRNALYLGYEAPDDLPQAISTGFEKVSALEKIDLPEGSAVYLYLCENYQMAPL